ncbi:MAG: pirin family protein [Bacteroidia bacterium]|nr:pirin family protein [Bacteroidia bacterium]
MKRRKFIKGSAILGTTIATPLFFKANSGMFEMKGNRKVAYILDANKSMVGTLPILRAFAGGHTDLVSPYVLLDEFGPVDITPGKDPYKVEAHPHAGVIPTTYLLEGSGHHKDSLNYDFQISRGEFMMFNSGKGAIHMEEGGKKMIEEGGRVHGFQIWLNIPAAHKFIDPSTDVFRDPSMASVDKKDYSLKVILGEAFGKKSKIDLLSPAFYFHVKMKENGRMDLPTNPGHNAFVYVVKGSLELEGQKALVANQLALFNRGESLINLYSQHGAEFLILGGEPLKETVYSYGPFVMNNEQQIIQCIQNYRSGKMGNPALVNQGY